MLSFGANVPSSPVPRRDTPPTRAAPREPLAGGSYSEYLAKANWDVRAHAAARGGGLSRRPRARENQTSADQLSGFMEGIVKRAKRSVRRAARSLREQLVRSSPALAAPQPWAPCPLCRHAARRPRHLPPRLCQRAPRLRQGVALGAAGSRTTSAASRARASAPSSICAASASAAATGSSGRRARATGSSWSTSRSARARPRRARSSWAPSELFERGRVPDAHALQVGRRPRRAHERALPASARRRAARRGERRAVI